jgi:homoserine dehydrogenase
VSARIDDVEVTLGENLVTQLKIAEFPNSFAAEPCKVAVVGFGTVGSSVARILSQRGLETLQLRYICNRNLSKKNVAGIAKQVEWTENFEDILDSDVDVVVELIGGLHPAEDWVRRALKAGKSVVTANKQLIANRGPELTRLAQEHGQHIIFGASVAGGIPVISGLQEGLAGDRIVKLQGILNGTCNYILTRIENAGLSFEQALAEAQAKGFAEANAEEDIDGHDARAKLTILCRAALKCDILPEQIAAYSIAEIEQLDFEYAHDLGYTIRQVSTAELHNGGILARVQPSLVDKKSALARVTGSKNLLVASGEFGGDTEFSGFGAGGGPTAVAVVSDVVWLAMNRQRSACNNSTPVRCRDVSADFDSAAYVRFKVDDRPGIIAAIASCFAAHGINIDSIRQQKGHDKSCLPFVITLESCRSSILEKALKEIRSLDFLVAPPVSMPVIG